MQSGERYAPISGVSAVSREKPRNLAASVRQKLFNRAQQRHEDFGLVLTKYGLERFLYRLAQSKYWDQFVLKGALLFELWTHRPYRPTRDLDLEGYGENSIARIKRLQYDKVPLDGSTSLLIADLEFPLQQSCPCRFAVPKQVASIVTRAILPLTTYRLVGILPSSYYWSEDDAANTARIENQTA